MDEIKAATVQSYPQSTDDPVTNSPARWLGFTHRQRRTLTALLKCPHSREELDTAACTSNVPDVVAQLRRRGFEIPCKMVKHVDRDGIPGRHGLYSLSDTAREHLEAVIRTALNSIHAKRLSPPSRLGTDCEF